MTVTVAPLDPADAAARALVATRMGETLVEVLGAERAAAVHTPDEITARLDWHLDPAHEARVLVARADAGELVGHTLLRVHEEDGRRSGLFATVHVTPTWRRRGVASRLLTAGEAWMAARGLDLAQTWTDAGNRRLAALFEAHGYTGRPHGDDWLILSRELPGPDAG